MAIVIMFVVLTAIIVVAVCLYLDERDAQRARDAERRARIRLVQAHAEHRLHQITSDALQRLLDEARRRS